MNKLKKHVIKIMGIFIIVILAMCGTVYGRYVIDRSSTVKISSAPFYLNATIDSNIVFNEGETATLTIKNNNGTQYNTHATTYEIKMEGNSKFTFSIDGENAVNNVITKTISGGSKIDNSFEIKFTADINELNATENVTFKIIAKEPYVKTIELPMTVSLKQTTVTLNANGGTVNPAKIIVNKNETYADLPTPVWAGHIFNGWYSAAEGGTKYENTTKVTTDASTQTLYAQWTSLLLADKVKVGDYVNYSVSYSNVYTGNAGTTHMPETSYTGWRVISIEGSGDSKYVKLVTAGVPLSYVHPNVTGSGAKSVTALTTNFFSTNISSTSMNYYFRKCGFSNSTTTISQSLFKNSYTQTTSAGVPIVQAMTKDDLDAALYAINKKGPTNNGYMVREEDIGSDLLAIPSQTSGEYAAYYLATYMPTATTYLWNVRYAGGVIYTSAEHGVRPVVSLKASVQTTGQVSGVWQMSTGQ